MAREAGTPNKNKAFLLNKLKDMYGKDFDPIMMMAEQAVRLHAAAVDSEDGTKALVESINGWDKIAQYVQPKLKAIEVTGEGGDAIELKHRGLTVNLVKSDTAD